MTEIATPKHAICWKRVSDGDGDVYAPWHAPVKTLGRTLAFGEVESAEKAIAPSVEGERAGDGDGGRNGDDRDGGQDGDVDGATSGSSIDSNRVNAALLAGDSQHMHYSRRKRDGNSPVSSWPPTNPTDHPYRGIRCRWRCRRIKSIPAKVSQTLKVEKTYLQRANATQPPQTTQNT